MALNLNSRVMTNEEKAKAYDEALERAREIHNEHRAQCFDVMVKVFPELAENKDEKIRKELNEEVKDQIESIPSPDCRDKEDEKALKQLNSWLAWLEKQGEQKHDGKKWIYEDSYIQEKEQVYQDGIDEVVEHPEKYGLTKQKEQKPDDKVEPKFKVGDWCIDNEDGTIFQIVKVSDGTYTYKTNEGKEYSCSHYSLEIDARLWTIQDAKDGDILCCDNGDDKIIYLFKEQRGSTDIANAHFQIFNRNNELRLMVDKAADFNLHTKPATKEQRDLLFNKMKEAGYEWDAEKKELKIVDCSKEDDSIRKEIIDYLKGFIPHHDDDLVTKSKVWIDWLEKQGEIVSYYEDKLDRCACDNFNKGYKKALEHQGEQKPAEWTDEGDFYLNGIYTFIMKNRKGDTDEIYHQERNAEWLKSLKERFTLNK